MQGPPVQHVADQPWHRVTVAISAAVVIGGGLVGRALALPV